MFELILVVVVFYSIYIKNIDVLDLLLFKNVYKVMFENLFWYCVIIVFIE